MKTLSISGSRFDFVNGEEVEFKPDIESIILALYKTGVELSQFNRLVHGGAIGFDNHFSDFVRLNYPNIEIITLRPNYLKGNTSEIKRHNKQAPMLRNYDIVKEGDFLLAVMSHPMSRGTQNSIDHALAMNIPYLKLIL